MLYDALKTNKLLCHFFLYTRTCMRNSFFSFGRFSFIEMLPFGVHHVCEKKTKNFQNQQYSQRQRRWSNVVVPRKWKTHIFFWLLSFCIVLTLSLTRLCSARALINRIFQMTHVQLFFSSLWWSLISIVAKETL